MGRDEGSACLDFPGSFLCEGEDDHPVALARDIHGHEPGRGQRHRNCRRPREQAGHLGKRVYLRNQAFVWDSATGIHGLGAMPDDVASLASDITSDGTCISGLSVGDNRVGACIWKRVGNAWKVQPLPQATAQLGAQSVVISDNGHYAASVDGEFPCLWSKAEDGPWTRIKIGGSGAMIPRGVNNSGVVVGVHHTFDGMTHANIWTKEGGLKQLEKPKEFVKSEANAVNNAGVVVGMVDGPPGSSIGPNAFVYENGRLRLLDEGGPDFASATAINDSGQVAGVLEKDDEHAADKAEVPGKPKHETRAPVPPRAVPQS